MANLLDDLLTAADHLGKRVREFEQALRSAYLLIPGDDGPAGWR